MMTQLFLAFLRFLFDNFRLTSDHCPTFRSFSLNVRRNFDQFQCMMPFRIMFDHFSIPLELHFDELQPLGLLLRDD